MRKSALLIAILLTVAAAAQAEQPWQVLLQASFADTDRAGVHVAAPVLDFAQAFVEFPGAKMASQPGAEIYRAAFGVKVYPTHYPVYVGAGTWTPDHKNAETEFGWLAGARLVSTFGFTLEVGYSSADGLRLATGASF